MKDVFISYSRKDKAFVEALHKVLNLHERDTWIDWMDIPLTADWWQEIETGIATADTFVFILSPESIAARACQEELNYAIKLNKRLIPVVRREGFDSLLVHPALAKLNWIFFREIDDFEQAFQGLLQVIDTDLDHVKTHTKLLERALEWDRKQRDDSWLLRGNALDEAEQWLALSPAKQPQPAQFQVEYIYASRQAETLNARRTQANPLRSIEQFLQLTGTSKERVEKLFLLSDLELGKLKRLIELVEDGSIPIQDEQDIFISYSRDDKPFVRKLHSALKKENRKPWVDWAGIAPSTKWWQEIEQAIERADNFVFVLSPNSAESIWCNKEVDHAVKHNKRIVVLLHQNVDTVMDQVHSALKAIHWISFHRKWWEMNAFQDGFKKLLKAIDTDYDHVRYHTRLLERSQEWKCKEWRNDLLLWGESLREAENWLLQGQTKRPFPTDTQKEYIAKSRERESLQRKRVAEPAFSVSN